MKDNCEMCGTSLKVDNYCLLTLIDDTHGKILDESEICKNCLDKFDFTIGAFEWEERK